MNITQNLQMKFTFMVFTLLVAVVISGAASASLESPVQSYPSAYVVENGYSFSGSASIQDAADNYETLDGNHIKLEPGIHEEQVVLRKNLTLTGVGATSNDTIIQSYNDNGGTVTIASGTSVGLENMVIWNYGNGPAVVNNGQLTITNCFLNGVYVANEVRGEAVSSANTETTTSTGTTNLVATSTSSPEATSGPIAAKTTGPIAAKVTTPIAALNPSAGGSTAVDQQQNQIKQTLLQKTVKKLVPQLLKVQQVLKVPMQILNVFITAFKVQAQLVQPLIWGFR